MGVTGLWRLIEPAGKPVPVETLENKVLAVDISIWLHQMVKGYQDAKGAPLPNAHLMGLFQRLCKLLYFKIKPVFVFDGGFPDLKKETIAKRQDNKLKYNSESERLKRELAILLSKKTAINSLLGKQASPKKGHITSEVNSNDDIFKLPALPEKEESESESEDDHNSSGSAIDLHSVNIESKDFKSLPVKEKYDLLIELKETRKMNSWGRLHELPKKSDNFSDFQMQRLLKRRKVQECIEETEKEMGDAGMSLNELESLLNEEGIETKIESLPTRRIASNNTTRFLLINKQALKDAKKKNEIESIEEKQKVVELINKEPEDDLEKAIKMSLECVEEFCPTIPHKDKNLPGTSTENVSKDELEEDLQKAIKMPLESNDVTDKNICQTDDSWTTFLTDSSIDSDEDDFVQPDLSSAKAYIMQYSDFTSKAINEIMDVKSDRSRQKQKSLTVDRIIEELDNEKSIIVDNIDLSSDEKETLLKDSKGKINKQTLCCSDVSQESSKFIESSCVDIIELDNSSDQIIEKAGSRSLDNLNSSKMQISKDSELSEDDFEEVIDEDASRNPIIQLTLDVKDVPDDNDIFADVFISKDTNTYKVNAASSPNELTQINIEYKSKGQINDVLKKEHIIPTKTEDHNILDTNTKNKKISFNKDTNVILTQPAIKSDCTLNDRVESSTDSKLVDKTYSLHRIDSEREDKPYPMVKEIQNRKKDNSSVESQSVYTTSHVDEKYLTEDKLNSMVNDIQSTERDIMQEKGRLDRIGRNITEQMTKDAQELLQIFGIPYVVAPMEAEAQCAFLETIKLTDGTITDDSDIWLFGGRTVYKNFFNQKKNVMQFLAERVEKSFNLTREQLILLALLVGSDYTTGVTGIGPVTALEILSSFPFNKKKLLAESSNQARYVELLTGLKEFKQWVRGGKRTDNINLKKKIKNVVLAEDFPSTRVVQAYLEPNIEKSNEKFTWGDLDITVLRDYTKAKFGWSQNKLDEIIKPVLKRIAEQRSQKSVKDYFNLKVEFQSLEDQMSKRVKEAIQRMGSKSIGDEKNPQANATQKNRKRNAGRTNNDSHNVKLETKSSSTNSKRKKKDEEIIFGNNQVVKVMSENNDNKSGFEINVQKSDRFQEIIPQREKDMQNILQNKLKAIELFRKTNIDRKKKYTKRKVILPKEEAGLSESSDSN